MLQDPRKRGYVLYGMSTRCMIFPHIECLFTTILRCITLIKCTHECAHDKIASGLSPVHFLIADCADVLPQHLYLTGM